MKAILEFNLDDHADLERYRRINQLNYLDAFIEEFSQYLFRGDKYLDKELTLEEVRDRYSELMEEHTPSLSPV